MSEEKELYDIVNRLSIHYGDHPRVSFNHTEDAWYITAGNEFSASLKIHLDDAQSLLDGFYATIVMEARVAAMTPLQSEILTVETMPQHRFNLLMSLLAGPIIRPRIDN